jgi:hypothetical protein
VIPPGAWGEEASPVAKGEPIGLPLEVALNMLEDEANWQPVRRNRSS